MNSERLVLKNSDKQLKTELDTSRFELARIKGQLGKTEETRLELDKLRAELEREKKELANVKRELTDVKRQLEEERKQNRTSCQFPPASQCPAGTSCLPPPAHCSKEACPAGLSCRPRSNRRCPIGTDCRRAPTAVDQNSSCPSGLSCRPPCPDRPACSYCPQGTSCRPPPPAGSTLCRTGYYCVPYVDQETPRFPGAQHSCPPCPECESENTDCRFTR